MMEENEREKDFFSSELNAAVALRGAAIAALLRTHRHARLFKSCTH